MAMTTANMEDALTSMLRTDLHSATRYRKTPKTARLLRGLLGYVPQLLGETDQLIVGRRGTGKTTLLYRALVECMRSWKNGTDTVAKPRTLGIYLELNKCQALADVKTENFEDFEHVFITELCEVIKEELNRSWPELAKDPGFFGKLFSFAEAKKAAEVRRLIDKLADVLKSGIPRFAERNVPSKVKSVTKTASTSNAGAKITASVANPQASLETNANFSDAVEQQTEYEERVTYRLTVADIVRLLGTVKAPR